MVMINFIPLSTSAVLMPCLGVVRLPIKNGVPQFQQANSWGLSKPPFDRMMRDPSRLPGTCAFLWRPGLTLFLVEYIFTLTYEKILFLLWFNYFLKKVWGTYRSLICWKLTITPIPPLLQSLFLQEHSSTLRQDKRRAFSYVAFTIIL